MLFAKNMGFITKVLTNRFLVFLGNISSYMFLIHFVITVTTITVFENLGIILNFWQGNLVILLEFVVTVVLSELYIKISKVFIAKKSKTR